MKLSFVITNEEASYVANKDSFCLFSIVKEVGLDKHQLKTFVLFSVFLVIL